MINRLLSCIVLFLITTMFSYPQQVIKTNLKSQNSSEQFETALKNGREYEAFWIGYSIQRNDDYQVSVGSFIYGDGIENRSFRNVILNPSKNRTTSKSLKKGKFSGRTVHINNGISIAKNGSDKETAILFRYTKDSKGINDFNEIGVCNFSQNFDLENLPLIWLGESKTKESLDFLFNLYNKSDNYFTKQELIPAIGIHTDQAEVITFLKNTFNSTKDDELKEEITFWLGLQNNKEAFLFLKKIINGEYKKDIKENAVMSLSYIKLPDALDELINITRHNSDDELRQHAVHAIGNIAVEKAEKMLKEIIEENPDIEVKKHAVYALANSDKNIPYLVEIAKNHESLSIRKSAIYSLSNSDDKRAVDALIELAKNTK